MKNGKAAGPDDIPPEALKVDLNASVEMLYSLFERIWKEEDIPTDWKEGHLIKLPQKATLATATITGVSHYYMCQVKSSIEYSWRE